MLNGQKKDRRHTKTVFDPIVREARKTVQLGKHTKAGRRLLNQAMRQLLAEELS